MHLSRRGYLRLSGGPPLGLALGCALLPRAALATSSDIPSLREVAASRGLVYGSDSDAAFPGTPQIYRDLFLQQCALYAPDLGWRHISRGLGSYNFSTEQPSIDFAISHGIKITGAHLLWHEQIPDWFGFLHGSARAQAVKDHAVAMCTRFAGRVFAWNVVNEAINPREGRSDGLRRSPISPDYFVIAFEAARAADPRALLVYNDFGMELDTANEENRRVTLLKLLDWLQNRGSPIDAVGLQSHLRIENFTFDAEKYRSFLHQIASRGLRIVITELDVLDKGAVSDFSERDRLVADVYSRFLNAALAEPAVCALVTWGLSDRYTWLTPAFSSNFARVDGLPTRPLPFDVDFRPKPAFFAILNALKNAPERQLPPLPAAGKSPPG